ncbi:DUF1829 domain-containing protein [Anaerocellum danielii]|uniref:DUF1829 domain-containing protein n=1 Tax=Anaerocellum danielii TaxID=1387557 RepID=A0ABZ0TYB8_9FIRM|nr:DUF1829 domain-containing protein [Caldicellulosiruptor danielii]WPX08071.1 DUF1829 domain-containing protein [Caldicellulosiruptor danielii]
MNEFLDERSFIDLYLKWLKENTEVKNLKDNVIELTTPFLDRHNDYIQIYVIKDGDNLILTDDGYTLSDLEMSGMEINTERRKKILKTILNGFGVSLEKDALVTKCDIKTFPLYKHNLIQAILAVNDMFMLSRHNVASIFIEDVESFLIAHDIRYVANINLVGKSGFSYKFDFAIPKSKKAPERFIKAVNNPTKDITKSIIFSWNDTKQTRENSAKLYAMLNDEDNDIPQEIIRAFLEYAIIPVKWSERNNYIEDLAA